MQQSNKTCRFSMMEVWAVTESKSRKGLKIPLQQNCVRILSWSYITDHILRDLESDFSSWWFQHLLKNMLVKLDHFPKDGGESKKIFELPPPSHVLQLIRAIGAGQTLPAVAM